MIVPLLKIKGVGNFVLEVWNVRRFTSQVGEILANVPFRLVGGPRMVDGIFLRG
jgi:hypothetical protein